MARGRSSKIIAMIQWMRTSRLSTENSLSLQRRARPQKAQEKYREGSGTWSSNPSGKCSYERPTRGTVCGTMRSMCGADAGCLAINFQSLSLQGGACVQNGHDISGQGRVDARLPVDTLSKVDARSSTSCQNGENISDPGRPPGTCVKSRKSVNSRTNVSFGTTGTCRRATI